MNTFLPGSVGDTLTRMRGVWHDHVSIYDLAGHPLTEDVYSGTPGPAPFDNFVYVDFDGQIYRQTNVTFRGRPLHARAFSGRLVDGVLVFDKLGPDAPEHIGVSGGPGILFFIARIVDDAMKRYSEPDCVRLIGTSERTRTTVLYRGGVAVRTLTAWGQRLSPDPSRRLTWDPRGPDGDPHETRRDTFVFQRQDPPAPRGLG